MPAISRALGVVFALTSILRVAPASGQEAATASRWVRSTPVGPPPVSYEISFENRAHHEARVRIRFTDLQPGVLELRMSRSSPGRYALHEFAKNVYDVQAVDGGGRPLEVDRPDPHQWNVSGHGGEVVVTYRLFADRADGTYAGVDRSHAHLNIPATFMWARGLFERPVELRVTVPEGSGWKVATQLVPTDDPTVFTAPDLWYFMDSPVEVSDFDLREWTLDGRTFRAAVHHRGTPAEVDRYVEGLKAIVRAERVVWGELPAFDHGTYTFLACYLPWVAGDGMEHRNSTVLTSTGSLDEDMPALLSTAAHEFFHAWNMERIRAAALEPFDFERADMSRELWFGEGFTSYYDDLSLVRAGLLDPSDYARGVSASVSAVMNAPGRRFFSPVEMSMQAPFVDAAVSVDPVNRGNTFLSYYTWGSVLGLGLDLTLRTRFPGLTLDDFMRAMWETHGTPERPYTVDDLQEVLVRVTGDPAFADDFFGRFIRGRAVPDYAALLARVGFLLRPASPERAILGRVRLVASRDGYVVSAPTLAGTPLYAAGADEGDVIHAVAGTALRSDDALERALRDKHPGDEVEVEYTSRGRRRTATVRLVADPTLEVVPMEATGREPSAPELALRRAWLGR